MKKSDNFDIKWGESLSLDGWVAVPVALIRYQKNLKISSMEMNVLLNLLMHWWDKDKPPFPSQIAMAERIGVSTRTIQRNLNTLCQKKLITKTPLFSSKNSFKNRNIYNLMPLVIKLNEIHNMKKEENNKK